MIFLYSYSHDNGNYVIIDLCKREARELFDIRAIYRYCCSELYHLHNNFYAARS